MKHAAALTAALLFNAFANLLMKAGMRAVGESGGLLKAGPWSAVKTVASSAPLIFGLALFAMNAVFYMYALQSKSLKISIAYPIMVGGGFALIAVVARFHPSFAERLTWGQWLGVAFVLLGVVLIAAQIGAEQDVRDAGALP